MSAARALATRTVEKPWGRERLPSPFETKADKRIGEIWFEPPAELDALLVKYLFTSEKLSVQVHPSDDQAPLGSCGKEECWLILDAEPGTQLAIGFDQAIEPEAMREAALDGSIEKLLTWHMVEAGDFFYLPAGTVHAIGAGLTLIEIQQNSDVTYRLYDYGRPRELHLDEAIAVAQGTQYDLRLRRRTANGGPEQLVDGPFFRISSVKGPRDSEILAPYAGAPLLVVPIDGQVEIAGTTIPAGGCGLASDIADIHLPKQVRALVAQPTNRAR